MSKSQSPNFNRRQVLRGAGALLALPWLEALSAGERETDLQPLKRLVCVYGPHGVCNAQWYPKEVGLNWKLSPSLAPLAKFNNRVSVISGLCHPRYPENAGHSGASRWLTGVHPEDQLNNDTATPVRSISLDQQVAQALGDATRFPSLQLSSEGGTGLPQRSATLSFDLQGRPLPALKDPRLVFNRLFVPDTAEDRLAAKARQARRLSLLDGIGAQLKSLQGQLGVADRKRLDAYTQAVREVELQLDRDRRWADRPKPEQTADGIDFAVDNRSAWVRLMYRLAALALRTDSTRVITLMTGVEVDNYAWPELGFSQGHHSLQHHNGDQRALQRLAQVDKRQVELLAEFLTELDAAGLLDTTAVLFGSAMNNGNGYENGRGVHSTRKLPLLLAGGTGLGLKQGQHLRFENDATSLCCLYLTLLRRLGVQADSFMDGTKELQGL